MKFAISGKGGVGKTLIASYLSRIFAEAGYSVIAIDADPDANLATSLGFPAPDQIIPISEMKELIKERTGIRDNEATSYFKMNPTVADIPDKYALKKDGISLMVMGRVKNGGTGCYCPENAFLQSLMTHLLLKPGEVVIMDMSAGIEHLSRGTARMVDKLIIVVEPGRKSVETARRITGLAKDLGIRSIAVIANKIREPSDKEFLTSSLSGYEFLGFIPYDPAIPAADMKGTSLLEASPEVAQNIKGIYQILISGMENPTIKNQ
ncbi:MAG: carbon monoxide dehydrogenase accessory protein CooC [Chloroflexota bacterium]